MSKKIKQMTAQEVETLLKRYDFELISQKGSHKKWRHLVLNKQVIVPYHKGKTLPVGTLKNILTCAEIPESEWRCL